MGKAKDKAKKRPAHEVILDELVRLVGILKILWSECLHDEQRTVVVKINLLLLVLQRMVIPRDCLAYVKKVLSTIASSCSHTHDLQVECERTAQQLSS